MRLKTQINILKSLKSSQSGSILLSEAYTINSEERNELNIGTTISTRELKVYVNNLITELRQSIPDLSILSSPSKVNFGKQSLSDLNTSLLVYKPYNDIFNKLRGYVASMNNAGEQELAVRLVPVGDDNEEDTVLKFFEKIVDHMQREGAQYKNQADPLEAVKTVLPSLIEIMQKLRDKSEQMSLKGRRSDSSEFSYGANIRADALHSIAGTSREAFTKELEDLHKLSQFCSGGNVEEEDDENIGTSIPALALQVATLLCKAAYGSGFDGVMAYFNNLALSVMPDDNVSNFLHEVPTQIVYCSGICIDLSFVCFFFLEYDVIAWYHIDS